MKPEQQRGRKLMPLDIKVIQQLYKTKLFSCAKLGEMFGVSWQTIHYHVSDKEKERVAIKREEWHERARTIKKAHERCLQLRKEHQRYKFSIQYTPLRKYYTEYARNHKYETTS